jgi:hypothetical protein
LPPTGTQTLVKTVFAQWHEANVPTMRADDAWEVFTAWLILKDSNLTLDVVREGVVDGSNDAGVDAVFTLLEGTALEPDSEIVEKSGVAREYRLTRRRPCQY